MLNRVTWAGLIVMTVAVLLYLGDVLTTFTRPMLSWIAAVGGVLFLGGIVLGVVRRGQTSDTSPTTPDPSVH